MEKAGINPINTICTIQANILSRLISKATLNKMMMNEAANGRKAYTAQQMFSDLRKTIWTRTAQADLYKRNTQRVYVESLIKLLDKSQAPAMARGELITINSIVKSAAASCSGIQKSHYQNLQAMIEEALSNK